MVDQYCERRLLIDELTAKVIEEEAITLEILRFVETLKRVNKEIKIANITMLIFALKNSKKTRNYLPPSIHNKIINIILEHPKIDPLYISATQKDAFLVNKFLNNPRSNKILTYIGCVNNGYEIKEIIGGDIIVRMFLYKQYFLTLPKDIFNHFVELQIF